MRSTTFIAFPVKARHAGDSSISAVNQHQDVSCGGRFAWGEASFQHLAGSNTR